MKVIKMNVNINQSICGNLRYLWETNKKIMKKNKNQLFLPAVIIMVLALIMSWNTNQAQNNKNMESIHVDWSKNANIYEVNLRQFTDEGTIKAFEKHLPRLKKNGS